MSTMARASSLYVNDGLGNVGGMSDENAERPVDPEPFRMYGPGGVEELPSTIPGIRDALPEDQRAEFDRQVNATGAGDLPALLARWAMHIPSQQDAEEEALVARLRAGDFSGVTFVDETNDAWRNAG
jgi:hypothetical protein